MTITISIGKEIFEDILNMKQRVLSKEINKYWRSELLDIKIVEDKIRYDIKKVDSLILTNGLGEEKPSIKIECRELDYNAKLNKFEFKLGKILEQKNINSTENFKDNLIEELLKEKELLKDMMNKDPLTSLYNRRKMEEDLEIFTKQKHSSMLCAVFIDADRFKGINDNFGHDMGDKVLKFLATKIQSHVYNLNGEAYRYGGEEFIILCFEKKDELIKKLNVLREEIKSQKIFHPLKEISITVSMGVSFYDKSHSMEHFIKMADDKVYEAKINGRDRLEVV
ncbi:MAG: GGDEF domain-containing protein [Arcobacter sp.]|uniref:GGDEF domain-containing protein n=1 Tax=Arcobacter sp. TaxID=1872629 RepID=UPI003AFFC8B0